MPIPALLDPKNFAPDTGGGRFKEGFVRVDKSCYTVHQDSPPEGSTREKRPPFTALRWNVTRLTEELEPATDQDDNPITEVLYFGLGGKSITQVHPATGSGPEDDEPEDLGSDLAVEGNTLYLLKPDFQLNPKSGLANLGASLQKIGYTPAHLARVWAPDFTGVIFHMKTQLSEDKIPDDKGVERPISYKVADKFFPAGKSKSTPASTAVSQPRKGAGKATSSTNPAEDVLDPILMGLSETLDGQAITRKALSTKISGILQTTGVDTKLHVPVLTLVKDNGWLAKHATKYDFTLDTEQGTVTFGSEAPAAA